MTVMVATDEPEEKMDEVRRDARGQGIVRDESRFGLHVIHGVLQRYPKH